ncbi:MAG: DUF3352 domain-containing protein [Candidatus Limnocylindrales bacterium]
MSEYQNPGRARPPVQSEVQGTVVPISEAWAAGVNPIPVSPRSRRLRWAIAGAVVTCVVIASAAGAFVLSGAAGAKSLTASAAPKNAIAFLEVRTDLPGDQHANLADFMSHFPGFADRSQFDNALDELLNKLTAAVSPDLTYSSAFKPWMEGEVSVALMDVGSMAGMMSGGPMMSIDSPALASFTPPSAVSIFALKDRTAAESWVSGELTRTGSKATPQAYAGTTLYVIGSGAQAGAYAFTDQDLLVGTVNGVKAALDSKTNGSLADNANYQAAMKSLSGDSLARFYIDSSAMFSAVANDLKAAASSMAGSGRVVPPMVGMSSSGVPAWVAGSVRAESNDMVVNLVEPGVAGSSTDNHTSRLGSVLPGSTVGVFEVHSIGALVLNGLSALQSQLPATSPDPVQGIKDGLAAIGGLDWLGDGVAVVTRNGSTYGGGLVAEATDASTAASKVALVRLATLAGGNLQIASRAETYKGVDITVLSIPIGSGRAPVEIAVAAKDDLILAGYTDAFVKAVIDTTASTSLAAQSDYSTVMAAAGASNQESFYINVPALEDQIGQAVFAESPSRWTVDYKPYFDHIGGVGYSVVGGNTVTLRLVVTAR